MFVSFELNSGKRMYNIYLQTNYANITLSDHQRLVKNNLTVSVKVHRAFIILYFLFIRLE